MEFDLVLKGGTVYDGSGSPPLETDVGIAGERIEVLGKDLAGREVLDCRGLAVAPAFIDTHSHSDLRVLTDPASAMKVRQGVAVEVLGQDGISVAPVRPEHREALRRDVAPLLGDPGLPWDWTSAADYLRVLDARPAAVDRAFLVPHGALRRWVMGLEDRPAGPAERHRMRARLVAELDAGALGLSTGLQYPPCAWADAEELASLAEVVARRNKVFAVGLRSQSEGVLDALEEGVEVAERTGVHVHLSHLEVAGRANWQKADALLARLRDARARRLRFTADQHPYAASAAVLGAILPPWAHAGGPDAAAARLADPAARARIRQEILDPRPARWDNLWKSCGPEGIVLSDLPAGPRKGLVGKDLLAASREAGASDALEFTLDLVRDGRLGGGVFCFSQDEDVIEKIWAEPYVNGCTGAPRPGRPHPRAYGAFARILAWLVRERGATTLEEAVRKLTLQAAESMHLPASFGRVAAGAVAHLIAFDPDRVEERATFGEPERSPEGIAHVLVRGRPVVRGGEQTSELPGRVVRV